MGKIQAFGVGNELGMLEWPQWWNFEDKGQLGVDTYLKISRQKFFDFHWLTKEYFKHLSYQGVAIMKNITLNYYFSIKNQKDLNEF